MMLGMTSVFDVNKHTIVGGEIGSHIKQLSKKANRDLFVVRYNDLGVFCICEFMSPKRNVFIDIMNLGKSLANYDLRKAQELRQRLFAPLSAEETSRSIAAAESDYHHMRQDECEEEKERLKKVAIGE